MMTSPDDGHVRDSFSIPTLPGSQMLQHPGGDSLSAYVCSLRLESTQKLQAGDERPEQSRENRLDGLYRG